MKNLKFLLIFVSLVLFAYSYSFAQFSVGPRMGINLATITSDPDNRDDIVQNLGFQFGAVGNIEFNELLSLQPELLFSQKGIKFKNGSDYIKLTTNYLEIPVLIKVSFGSDDFKGFFNAGPYFGYWLSGKSIICFDGKTEKDIYEFDDEGNNQDNRLDLGLSFGGGMAFKIGSGNLIFDLRYGLGLADMNKIEGDKPDNYTKSLNRVIGISLGYLFSF